MAESLLKSLSQRLRRTNETLSDLVFSDVPGRVAKAILDLNDKFGEKRSNGFYVEHDLTQEELAQLVVNNSNKFNIVRWQTIDGVKGDDVRLFDTTRAESYGIKPMVSLEDGIRLTTEWFLNNKETLDKRYNAFVNH